MWRGQNLTLEVRSAEGHVERLADLAAELVRLPVDLIVAHTTPGVLAAQHATTTLPIVAAVMTDPVQAGSGTSLAHPGGNITGSFASRLELGEAPGGSSRRPCQASHGWRFSSLRAAVATRYGAQP